MTPLQLHVLNVTPAKRPQPRTQWPVVIGAMLLVLVAIWQGWL